MISDATSFEAIQRRVMAACQPWSGTVELTYRCNERCAMCYLGPDWGKGRKGDELSTVEVFDLLDQLKAAGCFELLLTGGEVTLRKDLVEIVDYAGGLGFSLTLKTNGTRITPSFVDVVARNPVSIVEISLLGSSEKTHDRIARIPGALGKTLDGIRALRAADLPVTLVFTAMTLNFGELHEARKVAESLGCGFRWTAEVSPRDDRSVIPLTMRLRPAEQAQAQAIKVREKVEDNGGEYPVSGYADNGWFCQAGSSNFNVNPYGEVQPCLAMRMDCGNIRERPFAEIWETAEPLLRLRSLRIADVYGCASCQIRDYCEACPGLFFTEMGDVTIPSPHTCEMAEKRYQAANGEFKPAGSRNADGSMPRPANVVVGGFGEPIVLKARLTDA